MSDMFRHGRRMVRIFALLTVLLPACAASRATRMAESQSAKSSETKTVEPIQNESRGQSRFMEDVDNETESSSNVIPAGAEQELVESPQDDSAVSAPAAVDEASPIAPERPSYPLNLGSVLGLADGQNPQVQLARERINEAYAQVDQADILWLPSLRAGINYNKHEGSIQDVKGTVFNTSRGSLYGGMGAGAVGAGSPAFPGLVANFHLTDAIFQPKIARHQASSRQFAATSARNDILCDSAVAYLELVRAEHRLAIAREARDNMNRVADLTGAFARVGQGAVADYDRLLAEVAARDGDITRAEELVITCSTKLAFLIHADPSVSITSNEPLVVPLNFTTPDATAQELVAQGLSRRPELAENRQLVGEACERLRRERYAPLIPSVLLGASYGGFGGGLGSNISNSSDRFDGDAVAYWEVRNLGFGEQAIRGEASSRLKQAQWREVLIMDRIAQEVVEAHGQVEWRRRRVEVAREGIKAAERSYDLNLQRIEHAKGLPIEALQSVQALAQARRDYLDAVIDHNVAQMKLCRATGWFEEPTTVAQNLPSQN